MGDEYDQSALLIALDATEQAGVPPELVERLRGLVRSHAAHVEWLAIARPCVRRANIAGEPIRAGDILSRGPDELIYRTRSPIPMAGVLGASRNDTRKGGRVDYLAPADYRGLLDGDPRDVDERIDRAFRAAMEREGDRTANRVGHG